MKNKIILNIVLVYFIVVSIVLILQLYSGSEDKDIPVTETVRLMDKLDNAVVVCTDSPVMLVNKRQVLCKNYSVTPIKHMDSFYVPLSFFENTPAKVYEVDWKPVFPEDFPFDKIYGGRNYGWRPRKSRIRFYEYENRVIWGMTARIIENFVHLTRNLRSSGDQGKGPQK